MDNDCVPTSGANVIMYWDANGYPNMSRDNNWITVANSLGTIMDHSDNGGVSRSDIEPGLETYFSNRSYGNDFSVTRDTSESFTDIQNQMQAGNPSMLSINDYSGVDGGYNVTAVGTEKYCDNSEFRWYKYVIVHDNWETTGKDVWFLYEDEDIDDVYEIEEQ